MWRLTEVGDTEVGDIEVGDIEVVALSREAKPSHGVRQTFGTLGEGPKQAPRAGSPYRHVYATVGEHT